MPRPHSPEKKPLHPRNPHCAVYDFPALCQAVPGLAGKLAMTPDQRQTIDFADPAAVLMLNQALLKTFYGIDGWELPPGSLCPPIPGRADYLHHVADLLAADHQGTVPRGPSVRVLDIGTGASCIYPLIGARAYGWSFVASDINAASLEVAARIIAANPGLPECLELRRQPEAREVFCGVIRPGERFDLTICNPPFHGSAAEARAANRLRLDKMGLKAAPGKTLNFGGRDVELWCPGGEVAFIGTMIRQSRQFASQVGWFSTLVAKSEHLRSIQAQLRTAGARTVRTITMAQGQKISRLVAWRFI